MVHTGLHYFICLSVCLVYCVSVIFGGFADCVSRRGRFQQTRYPWKMASMGERVGRVSSHAVSRWSRSPGCCGFRGVLWVRRDFVFIFRFVFFERTRPAASMRPHCLINLSTSRGATHRVPATNRYSPILEVGLGLTTG